MQGDAKGKGKDKKVAVQQFDEVNVNHIQEGTFSSLLTIFFYLPLNIFVVRI